MEEGCPEINDNEDFCNVILSCYGNSTQEDHRQLCAVVGAISQELKDHKIPLTPIAFFGAAVASLSRLLSDSSLRDPTIVAVLTLLSMILPKVSRAVLTSKSDSISIPIVRILQSESACDDAKKEGMKCMTHFLKAIGKVGWSNISPLYELLLGFIIDHQPKVRQQSHSCLCDLLRSFQGSALLLPASEGICNVFERCLLLASGSVATNTDTVDESKGAIEVLYVLNALHNCLPLMTTKATSSVLKYFKSLLELGQPIVTRHVTRNMLALCSHPTSEVSPELLLDLLCTIIFSSSLEKKSVDEITFIARLLHAGIVKAYAVNREICVPKLPIIFNALGEFLTCEHAEAIFATKESLKGIISTCIDNNLIRQGVEQIRISKDGATRKSPPTTIEKICTAIESLLSYQYSAVWDTVFQIISTMFDKLGESSFYLMSGVIMGLADMQKLPEESFSHRKQLHECIGSAVGAIGPEKLLALLPLNLNRELPDSNAWLLPILKMHTVGAHLSFFTSHILSLIGHAQERSQKLEKEGRIFSSRTAEALVYSLWSLLPAFCNYPVDTSISFKDLENIMCDTLNKDPNLHGIICSALQVLIQQNKKVLMGSIDGPDVEVSIYEEKAKEHYTTEIALENLNTIKLFSWKFFSVLSSLFLSSSKDCGGCLQATLREFSSISPKNDLRRFFKDVVLKKLLEVTMMAINLEHPVDADAMNTDNPSEKRGLAMQRARLLDLAASLLPGLNSGQISALYKAIKPALKDEDGFVQKKAYKLMSIMLKEHNEFLSMNVDDLFHLMIEMLPFCHFSAKHHRLEGLYFLITYVSKEGSDQGKRDIISSFLTEIILSLKEVNKKTRNRAYDLIVSIGHAFGDEEKGGRKEKLQEFFNMVAGGLAGQTPHMISAAVKGLARLTYEFSELVSTAFGLLPSSFLLLQRKNKEIVKANLGLLKVLVAKAPMEKLETHLSSIVEGLLVWQDGSKNHFKAKIKFLLGMLIKKLGFDAVKAVMPEEHMKLLTNIRKINERKERRNSSITDVESQSIHSRSGTSKLSKWNHTKIFSDFRSVAVDDDSENMHTMGNASFGLRSKTASRFNSEVSLLRRKHRHGTTKGLSEDLFDQMDDPLDLLDQEKMRLALRKNLKRRIDPSEEPEIDPNGRLIIREVPSKEESISWDGDNDSNTDSKANSRSSKKVIISAQKKRRITSKSGWAYKGDEYKSKKAGGDIKRKEKLEPYAYWPLDRKMLNRRADRKATARKGMSNVMKLSKFQGKSASGLLANNPKKTQKKRNK